MKELTLAWNTENMTAIRCVERRIYAFQGTRTKAWHWEWVWQTEKYGIKEKCVGLVGNNRHGKRARLLMTLNTTLGEYCIWWFFKNTNPQWVFSSVLYSRCYLLCKTATHTFSMEFPLWTSMLYIYLFKLRDYERKRFL